MPARFWNQFETRKYDEIRTQDLLLLFHLNISLLSKNAAQFWPLNSDKGVSRKQGKNYLNHIKLRQKSTHFKKKYKIVYNLFSDLLISPKNLKDLHQYSKLDLQTSIPTGRINLEPSWMKSLRCVMKMETVKFTLSKSQGVQLQNTTI